MQSGINSLPHGRLPGPTKLTMKDESGSSCDDTFFNTDSRENSGVYFWSRLVPGIGIYEGGSGQGIGGDPTGFEPRLFHGMRLHGLA